MLECVFKSHIPKVKSYKNSNTLLTPNGDCEFLKDLLKTTIRIFLVTATLMIIDFMLYVFKIYMSQSHHVKQYILTTSKIKNIRSGKLREIDLLIENSAKTPSNGNFRGLNSERGKRVEPKKSSFVSGTPLGEHFLSLTRPHSRICIRIYTFNFKKETNKQKKSKNTKNAKEKKISQENRLKKINLRPPV